MPKYNLGYKTAKGSVSGHVTAADEKLAREVLADALLTPFVPRPKKSKGVAAAAAAPEPTKAK